MPAGAPGIRARTDGLLLATAIMGQFLSGFASRIFIVSMPTIAAGLDADILAISWALIAYQLASISLSVVFGRLGDLHGRYVIYGPGFALMAGSSLLCGLAPNVLALILLRTLQGVGGAMVSSVARVLAMDAMPAGSEGRANGLMTMSFHGGLLIGPPVGGLVIDLLSWRWIFWLLVPLGVLGTVLTAIRARQARTGARRRRPVSIDYPGAGLLVVLTVALTLLLDRRSARMIGAGQQGVVLVVFAAALAAFVAHEGRALDPVVNLALFRIRMFTWSAVSLLIMATVNSVVAFLMPFYIQDVLHFSPSAMGLIFLAAPVFTITFAIVSGHLTDRVGPRLPASIGVTVTAMAFVVGLRLRPDSHWLLPTALMGLVGLGTGFFNTSNQAAIIGSVPKEYRGFATGLVQTMFGVGSLLGISLAGALLTVMFRYVSGLPDARPSPDQPLPFVSAMNAIYLLCLGLMVVALATSVMRGGARIETAEPGGAS